MRLHEAPSGMLALPMTDTIAEVPSLSNPRVSYSGLVSGASSAATIAATQFVAGSSRNFTDRPVESTQPPQQTALPAQSHQQTLQILAKRRVDDVVRETEAGPPRKRAKRSCRKCETPSPDCRGAKEVKLCNNLCRDCGQRRSRISAPAESQCLPARSTTAIAKVISIREGLGLHHGPCAALIGARARQRCTIAIRYRVAAERMAAAQEGTSRAESITPHRGTVDAREHGILAALMPSPQLAGVRALNARTQPELSACAFSKAGGTGVERSDRGRGVLEEVQCAQRCLLNSTTSDYAQCAHCRGYAPRCTVPRSKGAMKPRAGAIVGAYAKEGSGGRRQRVQRWRMRDSRSICARRCPGDP
ncbi:hypothetical protein DFH09DRAFT_1293524 [Mycena vulgaris]|nr:hypothetical protein DFH09DRAFT_1293524 [Mycena vulgaris]